MTSRDELIALVQDLRSSGRLRGYEADALMNGIRTRDVEPIVVDWLLPTAFDIASLQAWVLKLCTRLETTPSALSVDAGFAPSTLNRFLKGDRANGNLNASTIDAIIRACRASLSENHHVSP